MAQHKYTDVLVRIFSKTNEENLAVEMTLDELQQFNGYLMAGLAEWVPSGDIAADGCALFEALFADPKLKEGWGHARAQSPRHVRLRIDVPELHKIPWEILRDENGVLLAASGDMPFSRFLTSEVSLGGPIVPRPLKVLGVISAPENLSVYDLAPIDRKAEENALKAALVDVAEIQLEFLEPPITLERLDERLHRGFHIVHFIGHGKLSNRGQPALCFEDADRQLQFIAGDDFAAMLQRQSTLLRPRLLFLSACYSASTPQTESFQGIAQKAVRAGVPAVIAMQDTVSIDTAREFSQKFYQELLDLDGIVDHALNHARSLLVSAQREEATVPVLFMRLKDAALFASQDTQLYKAEPSFVGRKEELAQLQQGLTDHPVALIHGMAGSGKTLLAQHLAARMGFAEQSKIEIRLMPGETAYAVWQGLAEELRAKGFPQFYTGLEGSVQTEKGNWQERGTRLAAILRQKRFLIILDDWHNANLQAEVEGWQALFMGVANHQLTDPASSRFLLVSREDTEEFSRTLGIEPGKYLLLGDFPPEAVQKLTQQLAVELSDEEIKALYLRTRGHVKATRMALERLGGMSRAERQHFLAELPERKGHNDPGDPIVSFVTTEIQSDLTDEEQTLCTLLSLSRRPVPVDLLAAAAQTEQASLPVRQLQQQCLVEGDNRGYWLHDMIAQVFIGELHTEPGLTRWKQFHIDLGAAYSGRGNSFEAVYHFTQAEQYAQALELLLRPDIHQLNFAELDELRRQAEVVWSNLGNNTSYAESLYTLALRIGQSEERLGKYQNAIEWYNRTIKVAKTECRRACGWIFRAWAEHRGIRDSEQQVDELLCEAEKVLRKCPQPCTDLIILYLFRARILAERGDVKGSQKAFNSVFKNLQIKAPSKEPALITLIKDKPDLVPVLARAYHALGWAYHNSDESRAKRYLQYAKLLYEREPNRWMVGIMDNNIGATFRTWGKYDQAAESFADALKIADKLGDQVFIRPLVLINQAIANINQGEDGAAAERYLKSALNLTLQSGYMPNYPIVLETLGRMLSRAGKWREAESITSKYSLYAQETKDQLEIFYAQKLQVELALLRIEAGISTCQSQKDRIAVLNSCESKLDASPLERVDLWSFKAEYALLSDERSAAYEMVERAMELYSKLEPEFFIGPKIHEVRARILASQGQWENARADFKKSFEYQKDHFLKGHALYYYARMFHNDIEAREKMQEAFKIFEPFPYAWLAYEAWRFLNPEVIMKGIAPELYKSLWTALLRCGPFASDADLRALFVTAPLSPWRDSLPQANSPSARVEKTIAYLSQQRDDTGNNALVLFLGALSDLKNTGDACKGELTNLAEALARVLAKPAAIEMTMPQPSSKPLGITTEQQRELVEALLDCSVMSDRDIREAVVKELPRDIQTSITYNSVARVHVGNIVKRCADFVGGLDELLAAVRSQERNSIPMQNVDVVWQRIKGM